VCTTARPLFGLVVSGLFDVDLYYRLNVMLLHVDVRHQAGQRPRATLSEALSDRRRTQVTVRSSSLPAFERPFSGGPWWRRSKRTAN
jgi:transcriptional regulator of aromatic amino acid metabolism